VEFARQVGPYIAGDEFSASLHAPLVGENTRLKRLEFLEEIARGKQVLHIGFTDHLEAIDHKVKHDLWLHSRLARAATRCVGIDINAEAVAYCRDKLGVADIFVHDAIADAPLPEIAGTHWDVAILGEILEHVPNPVDFLQSLRAKYGASIGRLVVTVPNAFFLENFLSARKNIEFINTDHRYWFSPFTLGKVAHDAGWRLESFHYIDSPFTRGMRGMIQSRYPMLRETLVGILTP